MLSRFGSTTSMPPSSDGDAPTRIVALAEVGRGTVLADKYVVERVLGQGGMGVVVAATNRVDGVRVALKFLTHGAAADPESVERFLREARSASQIDNPHVTRVIEVGTLHSGAPFIVMEQTSLEGATYAVFADSDRIIAHQYGDFPTDDRLVCLDETVR